MQSLGKEHNPRPSRQERLRPFRAHDRLNRLHATENGERGGSKNCQHLKNKNTPLNFRHNFFHSNRQFLIRTLRIGLFSLIVKLWCTHSRRSILQSKGFEAISDGAVGRSDCFKSSSPFQCLHKACYLLVTKLLRLL